MRRRKKYKCLLCGRESQTLRDSTQAIIPHKVGCKYFIATKGEWIVEVD